MSVAAVSWAIDQPKLRHVDHLVLIVLADYVAPDGTDCWPAQRLVAARLGLNVGSVRRSVAQLVDRGLIVKLDRRRHPGMRGLGTWTYRLAVDNAVDYRAPARATAAGDYRAPARASGHDYRAPGTRLPRTSARAESLEPKDLPARARAREATPAPMAVDNDRDARRRNGAQDPRGSSGTARPPDPTPVDLHFPNDDERERVRAANAAERERRQRG